MTSAPVHPGPVGRSSDLAVASAGHGGSGCADPRDARAETATAAGQLVRGHVLVAMAMAAELLDDAAATSTADAAGVWLRGAWHAGLVDPLGAPDVVAASPRAPRSLRARDAVVRLAHCWRTGDGLAEPSTVWSLPPAALAVVAGSTRSALIAYLRLHADDGQSGPAASATMHVELALLHAVAGGLDLAEAAAESARSVALRWHLPRILAAAAAANAGVHALRGDRTATEAVARGAGSVLLAAGDRASLAQLQWHRGAAALLTSAPQDAVDLLAPIADARSEFHHPTVVPLAAVDLGEAAIRTGDRALLTVQRHLLERAVERAPSPRLRGSALLLDALDPDRGDPERRFHEARTVLAEEPDPLLRARVELALGEWLRRARRREDSRSFLANAADVFETLGARSLAARARDDLRLTAPGGRVEGGAPERLTGQERRIALLAAAGASNKRIASALVISPRTVGHHLSTVYRKLGVASRRELDASGLQAAED